MAKHKEEKTNVMRTLDQKKIPYTAHTYDPDGPIDGVSVAAALGQDPAHVFKTLVTKGASGGYYVFDIPVAENLDLKKAARAVGEKSVAMLPQKELLGLTGYVHGGCSPVGMKKQFPTVFHATAPQYDTVCVSAGKIGAQVECRPGDLIALLRAKQRISSCKEEYHAEGNFHQGRPREQPENIDVTIPGTSWWC